MDGTEGPFDDWARRPRSSAPPELAHRLGIAVYVAEPGHDGVWLHASPAVQGILGVTPDELINDLTIWHRMIHPEDRARMEDTEAELEPGMRGTFEYRIVRPDGRVVWVLDDTVIGVGEDGRPVMDGYLVDVTSQRRAERMVAAQAAVVEALTSRGSLQDALAQLPAAAVASTSAIACAIELPDAPPLVAHRDETQDLRYGLSLAADAHTEAGAHAGRVILHYAPGVEIPDDDREVPPWAAGLIGLAATRTEERHRADLMYAQLAATLESTADGIIVLDRADRIVGHNSRFMEIWGIDPALMEAGDGPAVLDVMLSHLADPGGFLTAFRHLHDTPEETSFDEVHTLDGRVLERSSRPQRIDGEPVGRVWSFREVTETRRLAAELREREASLDRLVGQVRDYAIVNLDPEGRVASWNQGAARIIRYAESEILGRDFDVFFPEEEVAAGRPERLVQRALAEGSAREDGWAVRQGGQRFWASTLLTALHDDEGRLRGLGLVMQDISERRSAELALERRARTLAAVGTIATAANSATSVGGALDTALLTVCEHGGWDLAHVYLVDDATQQLRHHAWHVGPDVDRAAFAEFIAARDAEPADRLPLPAAVMSKGRTMWVADLATLPPAPDGAADAAVAGSAAGLVSASAVPVLVGSEPVGVLEFFSVEPRPFDAESDLVMRQLGAQLGRVVERERAERRSAVLARHLARLGGNATVA